ncbi:hypothetical protein [Mucilaginibacter psychrotolerans]|uniref:Uncharacterized protein n=1 Tax=Mucilaginibacter psychrotolerans TaxID=1524096 RepID=A0A4Y8SC82_9SPHI|nr:hypothetical protein [Mucilaginibacter psychrotolerans]TFF36190.1 hypothetical protein E2R66_16750 [Mucilaginibacter psychrotolerans]
MLEEIVRLIGLSQSNASNGTLACELQIADVHMQACITSMLDLQIIENTDFKNEIGQAVNLYLSSGKLASMGYFTDTDALIRKHRYEAPTSRVYIAAAGYSDDKGGIFYDSYLATQALITAIKMLAKHVYTDNEFDYAVIFREDKGLILPLHYDAIPISSFSDQDRIGLKRVTEVFAANDSPEKLLYINELIDYLAGVKEEDRFRVLLQKMAEFADKTLAAYQYYLRDFSLNKLRLELDAKALEYTQKIQAVINDSQTKLVAIPTAFILVFSAFDFVKLNETKNWIAAGSLIIFAVLIQIFLANQYSSLLFTATNIANYKNTFSGENLKQFDKRFLLVEQELGNQRFRLRMITMLLWLIPSALIIIWIFLYQYQPHH